MSEQRVSDNAVADWCVSAEVAVRAVAEGKRDHVPETLAGWLDLRDARLALSEMHRRAQAAESLAARTEASYSTFYASFIEMERERDALAGQVAALRARLGLLHDCSCNAPEDYDEDASTLTRALLHDTAAAAASHDAAVRAPLEAALRGLLMSADCEWEERNEGHDWPTACVEARRVLGAKP